MLFTIIRTIFFGIVFASTCFLINKFQSSHKSKKIIISFVVTLVLFFVFQLLPLENILISFPSPEASYNYNHNSRAKLVVNGEMTDFVVGSDSESDVYAIIPKSNGKWKLSVPNDKKLIFSTYNEDASVDVFRYKNTNEYYISVLHTDSGPFNISDSRNSEFKCSKRHISATDETYYTYYAYINNFDEQYSLIVNGQRISMHK